MRIYTKIVLDIATGHLVEADWQEYAGPVAELKGGKVNIPGPSAEEKALQAEQTEILRQQRDIIQEQVRQQNLLAPFLFKSAGVNPVFDEEGNIASFEEIADPLQGLRSDIEKGFLERSRAALAGELPVNPALLRELGDQEQTLRESLRKQLGPGFETSSPGIESLNRFGTQRNELLEASRRGDLTLAESLGLARESSNEQRINEFLGRVSGINLQPSSLAAALGNTAQGFNAPISQLQNQRALQTQASIFNAQNRSNTLGNIFGGVGSLFGTALFAPSFGAGGPTNLFGRLFGR